MDWIDFSLATSLGSILTVIIQAIAKVIQTRRGKSLNEQKKEIESDFDREIERRKKEQAK